MIEVVSKCFVGKGLVEVEEVASIGFRRLSHAVQRGIEQGFIDHPDILQALDIDRLGNDQNFDAILVQAFDQFSKSQQSGFIGRQALEDRSQNLSGRVGQKSTSGGRHLGAHGSDSASPCHPPGSAEADLEVPYESIVGDIRIGLDLLCPLASRPQAQLVNHARGENISGRQRHAAQRQLHCREPLIRWQKPLEAQRLMMGRP